MRAQEPNKVSTVSALGFQGGHTLQKASYPSLPSPGAPVWILNLLGVRQHQGELGFGARQSHGLGGREEAAAAPPSVQTVVAPFSPEVPTVGQK